VAAEEGLSRGHKVAAKIEPEVVKRFLSRNLMASLSYLLTKLCNAGTAKKTKLEILKSLDELIRLLGPEHLAPVKHSLLACLKTSVNLCKSSSYFVLASVNLWVSFVRNIGLKSLAVIFPQVIVGLIFHLPLEREVITELLQFLLVENGDMFRSHMSSLVFLPDIQGGNKISLVCLGTFFLLLIPVYCLCGRSGTCHPRDPRCRSGIPQPRSASPQLP
jgi:hypothetical protein